MAGEPLSRYIVNVRLSVSWDEGEEERRVDESVVNMHSRAVSDEQFNLLISCSLLGIFLVGAPLNSAGLIL